MTIRANLYVDQGVDFLYSFKLDNFILENQQFFCDVRKLYSSITAFSAELEVVIDENSGELKILIDPSKTRSVAPGKYQYDILMVDENKTTKLLEGLMFILPTITKIPEE